jgi:hypothetical protein
MWLLSLRLRGSIKERRTTKTKRRRAGPLSRRSHPLRHGRLGLGRRPRKREMIKGLL